MFDVAFPRKTNTILIAFEVSQVIKLSQITSVAARKPKLVFKKNLETMKVNLTDVLRGEGQDVASESFVSYLPRPHHKI